MQNKHEGPGTGPDSTRVTSQGWVFRVETPVSKRLASQGRGQST